MYGYELVNTLLRLLLSGKSYTVRELSDAVIEAFPESFVYDYQKRALYLRILRHLHSMKKAGLVKMQVIETDLRTKKYKVCLDYPLKDLGHFSEAP